MDNAVEAAILRNIEATAREWDFRGARIVQLVEDLRGEISQSRLKSVRALLSSRSEVERMREAAQSVVDLAQTSVTDHEGQQHGMEDDRGEALYLVQFEAIEGLRAALSPQPPKGDDK